MMIYGSVCSGIEAATVAWHPLGWRPAFFSEIEAFPRAVLAERWPGVPIHGDFTTIGEGDYEAIELLVGGTPCQDFSVAGLRAGLAGDRGGLTIEFVHLARRLRPRWLVWENVPGILSIDDGQAFGAFLALLGQCGYGFAYRVLDAQHFGVPQRRRRVFVVGYLGDWRPAAAVLFEPESLRGDSAPRREAGKTTPAGAGDGSAFSVRPNHHDAAWRGDGADNLIPLLEIGKGSSSRGEGPNGHGFGKPGDPMFTLQSGAQHGIAFGGNNTAGPLDVSTACNAHGGPHGRLDFESETFVTHSLRADGFDASEDGTGRGTPLVSIETLQPIWHNGLHASPQETNANSLLSELWQAIGEEAFAEWRLGISDSFRSQEILRPEVHGGGIRREADESRRRVDDGPLPCAEGNPERPVSELRQAGRERRPPPGRKLPKQLARELGAALSGLSSSGASREPFLRDLWGKTQRAGVLQQALPPVQRRSLTVRRPTPREAERLQGFPDDYTAITYRGKPAADGNRYRALGNSMAVPVMHWLGCRIQLISDIVRSPDQKSATHGPEIRRRLFQESDELPHAQPVRQRHAG